VRASPRPRSTPRSGRATRQRGLAGCGSASVDHAGRPPGSRVPLRTPGAERDSDLPGEHRAETRVQLFAPRSTAGVRAFARSRPVSPPQLAKAARSQSHFFLLANFARGVSKQRPRRAISGAVAFLPHVSATFDARRARRARGQRSRREHRGREGARAEGVLDGVRALSSGRRGERNRERLTHSGLRASRSACPQLAR
jgi:hypothetical protein